MVIATSCFVLGNTTPLERMSLLFASICILLAVVSTFDVLLVMSSIDTSTSGFSSSPSLIHSLISADQITRNSRIFSAKSMPIDEAQSTGFNGIHLHVLS